MLTLLLSIKQDILSANLFGSLRHLSDTYSSIDASRITWCRRQLASLGESVAE